MRSRQLIRRSRRSACVSAILRAGSSAQNFRPVYLPRKVRVSKVIQDSIGCLAGRCYARWRRETLVDERRQMPQADVLPRQIFSYEPTRCEEGSHAEAPYGKAQTPETPTNVGQLFPQRSHRLTRASRETVPRWRDPATPPALPATASPRGRPWRPSRRARERWRARSGPQRAGVPAGRCRRAAPEGGRGERRAAWRPPCRRGSFPESSRARIRRSSRARGRSRPEGVLVSIAWSSTTRSTPSDSSSPAMTARWRTLGASRSSFVHAIAAKRRH